MDTDSFMMQLPSDFSAARNWLGEALRRGPCVSFNELDDPLPAGFVFGIFDVTLHKRKARPTHPGQRPLRDRGLNTPL
jgi:hypothetical protein